MFEWMFPLAIIFTVVVAPLWIIMHYSSKRKLRRQLSDDEHHELEILRMSAQQMQDRIQALEEILDEETPEWRKRTRSSKINDEVS